MHLSEEYLNEEEVSEITGKTISTLREERDEDIGCPYIEIGDIVVYKVEDVRKFMDAHRHETALPWTNWTEEDQERYTEERRRDAKEKRCAIRS